MRILLLLVLAGCSLLAQTAPTLLLVNGKIWTVDPAHPEVEAIAITGNRIVAVGTTEQIKKLKGPETAVFDLEGRRVLPVLNDSDVHFYSGGAN